MANTVITGTSQGIGLELTRLAVEAGDHVLAIARSSSHLNELKMLAEKHRSLNLLEIDLRDPEALTHLQHALKEWERVDILINNAGIYRKDETVKDFLDSFETNSVMPFFVTKALLSKLEKASHPRVVHISSLMGSISENSSGGSHAYRSSKAALNMISKGFSVEESWLISAVMHPGWVQTNMGGQQAPVEPRDAAKGIWNVIRHLKKEDSGKFFDYLGKELHW